MRRVVKRSFTDSDIPTNGIDIRVDIADSKRDRSGRPESSNFFNVIEEQKRERPLLPHCPEEIRQRSVTEPTILRTAGSLPRVLSAVKELDKNLAEERLDELDLNNLAELDKRMALQMEERRSTPRNTPSGSPRKFTRGVRAPSLLKIAQHTAMSKRSSSTASGNTSAASTASGVNHSMRARSRGASRSKEIEVTSPGSEASSAPLDMEAYGDSVKELGEDDLYLSPDLPLDRVPALCQKCAAICALNIMHQREYTLRSATETKLLIYQYVTSKGYHLLMLFLSIFHVILASFEPASVDQLHTSDSYIEVSKGNVLIMETVIVSMYVFDICIGRILSTNRIFWRQKLNLSRILCTAIMGLDLILTYADVGTPRFSRFLRPMQCILLSSNLYGKLISVLQAGLAAGKALSLLLLTIFVFSIAGMELFSAGDNWIQFPEERKVCGFDFRDVYHSFVSLWVLLTTENYPCVPCVMMPAIRGKVRMMKEGDDILVDNSGFDFSLYAVRERHGRNFTQLTSTLYDDLKREGYVEGARTLHIIFFVTFLLVTTFGVLNVLIASVYNTYRQHAIQTSYIKRTKERKSLLIAYELLTMNKMMTRESVLGAPYLSKEDAYLDYLTFRDLVKLTMGSSVDDEKLIFYWNKIDIDKSGYVDPLEFLSLVDVLGLTLFRVCETNLAKISVKSIWRTQLKRVVVHKTFRWVILSLLVANAVLLCTKGIVSGEDYGTILIVNDILSLVYLLEMILKIAALGREYWAGVWNRFDCFTIVMGALAALVRLKIVSEGIDSTFLGSVTTQVCLLSKVLRILRIMTIGKKESNHFLLLLFRILPTSLTFLVLTFLVCCVYAYIGIEVFSNFNEGDYMNSDYYHFASFSNFSAALLLMFQVLTTSNWHEIMLEANRGLSLKMHPNLAFIITAVYFISFGILTVNIVLNLMQAVFVDSWRQILDMNKKLKKKLVQVRHNALAKPNLDNRTSFHSQSIQDNAVFSSKADRKTSLSSQDSFHASDTSGL